MVNKLFLGLSELLSGSGCFRQETIDVPSAVVTTVLGLGYDVPVQPTERG